MLRSMMIGLGLLSMLACGRREGNGPDSAAGHEAAHTGLDLIRSGRAAAGLDQLRQLPGSAITARNIPAWHESAVAALIEQGDLAHADSLLALCGPVSELPGPQLYLSAQVAMGRGHSGEALRRYAAVTGDPLLEARAAFEMAVIHSLQGNHQAAAEDARRSLQVHAHDPAPRTLLVSSLIALDRTTLAVEEARLLPEGVSRWALEAHALLALGSADSASIALDKALAVSDSPVLQYLRGWALVEQERPAEALARLEPLAQQAYKDAGLLTARALTMLGRSEEADAYTVQEIDRRQNEQGRRLWSEGLAAAEARRPERARTLLEEAVVLIPDNASLLNDLGAVLTLLRRFEDAEMRFRSALALRPQDASTWGNLAQLYELSGQAEQREDALRHMAELMKR